MIPGTSRNQNQANGVTNTATRKVTSSARGSVFLGFSFDTAATDTITTSAWINHDDSFSASQVMAGRQQEPPLPVGSMRRRRIPPVPATAQPPPPLPQTHPPPPLAGAPRRPTP